MKDEVLHLNVQAKKLQEEVYKNTSLWAKNFSKAIEFLERALEIDPDSIITLTNLGAALCDSGKHKDAKSPLERAIKSGSSDRNTYFNMAVSIINTTRVGHKDYFKKASNLKRSEYTWEAYFDPHAHYEGYS